MIFIVLLSINFIQQIYFSRFLIMDNLKIINLTLLLNYLLDEDAKTIFLI